MRVAERFNIHPDEALLMPFSKILFYSQVMEVMDGNELMDRTIDKDDVKLLDYMNENKEDMMQLVENLISGEEQDEMKGLWQM